MSLATLLPVDSFNVIALIATMLLAALGLHFSLGLVGVVNMVHGEFMLVGAYTAYQVQTLWGRRGGRLGLPGAAGARGDRAGRAGRANGRGRSHARVKIRSNVFRARFRASTYLVGASFLRKADSAWPISLGKRPRS